MPSILLAYRPNLVSNQHLARIEAISGDIGFIVTEDKDTMESLLSEVEIAAGWLPREYLAHMPQLRWFQQFGAGCDWLMRYPETIDLPFTLTNASGIHAVQISEHILALMLAFARRLPEAWRAQQQRIWQSIPGETLFELAGKTILVVGMGPIGRRTAKICAALGMKVIGIRRVFEKSEDSVAEMVGPGQLLDVLPVADFVVLAVPLTPETQGMMDAVAIRSIKSSAHFINIGRGGLVDEGALIQALREGRIAGAGLDVFETEPLPEDSPLWGMKNVIVTAHYSGASPHYAERFLDIFLENLARYRSDQSLMNVVDKTQYIQSNASLSEVSS